MSRVNAVNNFIELHRQQLESSGVPEHFWEKLYSKLITQTFDAGLSFCLLRIDYEEEDRKHGEPLWRVQVKAREGVRATDPSHIYLIDHAWTYRVSNAKSQLEEIPELLDRMCVLMGIDSDELTDVRIDGVFREMWKYNQSYVVANASTVEDKLPIWYIMDEVGCGIQHSEEPNCRCVPFIYLPEQVPYTLLFATRDARYAEEVTRNYVEGNHHELTRKALLIPWVEHSFLDVGFEQSEPEEDYFLSGHVEETVPESVCLPTFTNGLDASKKKLKVFTEYKYVRDYLKDPYFELTENEQDADILWLTRHFRTYKELSETGPNKYINQFPFEYVVTVKDLLSVVCRRAATRSYDDETLDTYPTWLPTTFNLGTELSQFVSYFQHRRRKRLENTWICKPYNLARSLDVHITDNINYIIRLASTGPKIVQKYIDNPVLFYRSDVKGYVKFDVRYVILVQSLNPLQIYVYRNFFLRFANVPFSMSEFDRYDKHFTVMNYERAEDMLHVTSAEFLRRWNEQHAEHKWSDIEDAICAMLKSVFAAAIEKEPPLGICPNKQSRALYAADIMLEWATNENGKLDMRPKLLEINWTPDCQRACEYYPTFYNEVFSLLFLNMINERSFRAVL